MKFAYLGDGAQVFSPSVILKPEMISIGDHARLDSFIRIEGGLGVRIGEHVHIASFCSINSGGGTVDFGAHSGCACGVRICGGMPDIEYLHISAADLPEHQHVIRKRTVIGKHVVIFSNAIILPGVTLGHGCVVAAGAVVTCDVLAWSVVAGVPARFVRRRHVTKENYTP